MPPSPKTNALDKPVGSLRGVGPERMAHLARLDIHTVGDLLLHQPRRYEDRRHLISIRELKLSEAATTRGRIVAQGLKRYHHGEKSVFEIILDDGTARLHCRWWNLPFMEKYFQVGDEVFVYGKPKSLKPRTIDHPETETIHTGEEDAVHLNRVTPIYPLTEGLPQRWLRALIWRTLEQFERHIAELWPQPPASGARTFLSAATSKGTGATEAFNAESPSIPAAGRNVRALRPDHRLPLSRASAIRRLHFPEEIPDAEIARQRLALDEFIALQIQMQTRRRKFEVSARGLPCSGDNHLIKPFLTQLGFKLTAAQTKVLREMRTDLGGAHPMRRLLQGDVGSGKTVVAACCALMAMESGFNIALMAPTEILAEQHFNNFRQWFEPLGLAVELQTGNRKTSDLRNAQETPELSSLDDTSRGTLFVGTHALITAGLVLPNLGLVIIDEQHKFGVAQREQLVRKGQYPHLLVMTATPIPRTLGLTLYGDLDISVIDEMPAGRGRIRTFVRSNEQLPKVWDFIRAKLTEGQQVYVVYPRVEDTGTSELKAVIEESERLKKVIAPFRLEILHGRLRGKEKQRVMEGFRKNEIQVLLATSVIEVGLDVPNATVMLIENAERFGMA